MTEDAEPCVGPCRPLVACAACGRHYKQQESACPFCTSSRGIGPIQRAVVAAAFFGTAAIAGCAYGPPPDDFEDTMDAQSEVSADGVDETSDGVDGTSVDGLGEL